MDILNIDDMTLATTDMAKIDTLFQKKIVDTGKVKVVRNNFYNLINSFEQDLNEIIVTEKQIPEIEPRHYLLDCFKLISESPKDILKFQLPCGTGKTYIMLYTILETLKINANSTFIIFCPWIELAKQTATLFNAFRILSFIKISRKHDMS